MEIVDNLFNEKCGVHIIEPTCFIDKIKRVIPINFLDKKYHKPKAIAGY